MRVLQVFAVLAAVAADADHGSLRKQPCDKECQIKHAQGKVDDAEAALDKNMESSQANQKMIAYTKSIKGNSDIASQEKAVATETQTVALGNMLGNMWREMREYQSPMYEEKLGAQSSKLADDNVGLQAKLARARDELDAATAKEAAQEKVADDEVDDDEEAEQEVDEAKAKKEVPAPNHKPWSNNGFSKGIAATADQHSQLWTHGLSAGDPDRKGMYPVDLSAPPAKLVIQKPHGKSVEMHSKDDDDEKDDDDDDEDDDKKVSTEPVKAEEKPSADEDAEAVVEEAEQETGEAKAKTEAPAPNHKPWSNNGFSKGMAATADQHSQLWKHGLSAGDPGREGIYPVDLSAPIPETPLTPKETFGKEQVVEAPPEEPESKPAPAPKPAGKVAVDPVHAEAEEEDDDADEADAVKRVEAASEESKEDEDGDGVEDEEDEAEKEKAPTKAAAGGGDVGDGLSATHHQFKKFLSGGFFNGDKRQGLYPTDLTK